MTTPTVTELPRRLEPISRDTFVDDVPTPHEAWSPVTGQPAHLGLAAVAGAGRAEAGEWADAA